MHSEDISVLGALATGVSPWVPAGTAVKFALLAAGADGAITVTFEEATDASGTDAAAIAGHTLVGSTASAAPLKAEARPAAMKPESTHIRVSVTGTVGAGLLVGLGPKSAGAGEPAEGEAADTLSLFPEV